MLPLFRYQLLFVLCYIKNVYSQSVCLHNGSFHALGQYDDSGMQNNGKNYYVLDNTVQTDCTGPFYLFYHNCTDNWYVHTTLQPTCALTFYLECQFGITNMDEPWGCLNWQDYLGNNYEASLSNGGCPWPPLCDTISLSTPLDDKC